MDSATKSKPMNAPATAASATPKFTQLDAV
jgi:hypothetical protein